MSVAPFIVDASGQAIRTLAGVAAAPPGQDPRVWLRELLHRQPALLPLEPWGAAFAPLVSVGCGINTGCGELDNLLLSPHGGITLVMIDTPQSARLNRPLEALLEHARCLEDWSCEDLLEYAAYLNSGRGPSAEFSTRMDQALLHAGVSPAHFEGALAASLAKGDFLLLVVGERISLDVYAQVDKLQSDEELASRLAVIQLPFFRSPDERATGLLTVPQVVMGANRRASSPASPFALVPLVVFRQPTSCREFHDRLQAESIPWRTHVKRKGAEVFVCRWHQRLAKRLLEEHLAMHPDSPETGFQITYDYAIFGSLIAGAFGMILLAVELRHLSDLVRPILLTLLGGVLGWVLEKGRISRRATGSCQFSPADCLVACGAGVLAGLLFLGGLR